MYQRSRWYLALPLLAITLLTASSCNFILGLFNQPPTVTLSASTYNAYSDQDITFTASASDPLGDDISYSWYVNGVLQSETSSTAVWYWLNSTSISPIITVRATDSNGTYAEDSVTLNITPSASVRFINQSGYVLYYLYIRNNWTNTWSSELLGASSVLYNGYTYTYYGITSVAYTYDFWAQTSSTYSYYWSTSAGYYLELGHHRDFCIYPSNWYVDANSQANVAVHTQENSKGDLASDALKSAGFQGVSVRKTPGQPESVHPDPAMPYQARY